MPPNWCFVQLFFCYNNCINNPRPRKKYSRKDKERRLKKKGKGGKNELNGGKMEFDFLAVTTMTETIKQK